MKLITIGTGSSGNCYAMKSSTGEILLIEAGIQAKKIIERIDFNIGNISGCLISHEHGDHAKGVQGLISYGVKIYATKGTREKIGAMDYHSGVTMHYEKEVQIGTFQVIAFEIEHDAEEPAGFLINHPECGKVLFLTDTMYSRYRFKNLNQIIIEANYEKSILDNNLTGDMEFLRNRIVTSHMSIDTCERILSENDLRFVQNIVLIHLSDSNSNEAEFMRRINDLTGIKTHVSSAGMEIELSRNPF